MSTYEIISITISSISLVSIIILAISLIMSIHSSNQLRKSKAAEAITFYIQKTTDTASISVKIVSSFTQEQCDCLHKRKELVVDAKELGLLCYICPHREFCRKAGAQKLCATQDNEVFLHKDISYLMRYEVLRYLNNLESVLLYWELGVVDQKIIEKELLFLKYKDSDYKGLEMMRKLFGGAEAYPAIENYYLYIEKKRLKSILKNK